jgi:soluble lytic murein transglycosylase-like protein
MPEPPQLQVAAETRRLAALALIAVGACAGATLLPTLDFTRVVAAAATPAAAARPPQPRRPVAPCPFPAALRPAFLAAARDTNLPPALLYAVAKVESNLQPNAVSGAGARGVLQVMPETGATLAPDVDEPRSNVLAGARYLRQMLHRFGSTDLALAAYNAGPTAVSAYGGAPSGSVLTYVAKVTTLWRATAGCR